MSSIHDLPFVSKDEILDAYLPVQGDRSRESAFRRLRRDELISNGIALSLRGARGRMRGRPHIYCVLNRDAARLARHGLDDEARKLAQEADRVEGSEMVRDLVGSLERLLSFEPPAGPPMIELSAQFLRVMFDRDDSVRSAAIDVVLDIDAVRARASSLDEIQVRLYGKVARVLDDVAELDVGEGRLVIVPIAELEELGLSTIGTPVALLWERWGNGRVLIESQAAIELGDRESPAATGGDAAFDPFSYGEAPVRGRAADELALLMHRRGGLRVPRPIELVPRG